MFPSDFHDIKKVGQVRLDTEAYSKVTLIDQMSRSQRGSNFGNLQKNDLIRHFLSLNHQTSQIDPRVQD